MNDAPLSLDLDGEHAPLEVHFVHKSASGDLAVAAVLVEEGAHNPVLAPIIAALPSRPGDARHLEGLKLDMDELQALPGRYYRYLQPRGDREIALVSP